MQKPSERLYFIDNLRAFVIFLVILLHTSMSYMVYAPQWWYVLDDQRKIFFDFVVLLNDVFIMPIMFFAAGYFALPALIRKGSAHFWHSKLRRIVVPWVFGVLFLAPLIAYMILFSRTDNPPNYISFWFGDFWGAYFQHAIYWFLGVLTMFYLLLDLAYRIKPNFFQAFDVAENPSPLMFPLFLLLTTGAFCLGHLNFHADAWVNLKYLFVIQPTRIGIYILYFMLGIYSWQRHWFTSSGYRPKLRLWSILAIVNGVIFIFYRFAFTNSTDALIKVGLGFFHAFFCMAISFTLLALFQRYVDSNAYFWQRLAANSYGIYYIHILILLPSVYLIRLFDISIWLKFGLAFTITIVIAFTFLEYALNNTRRWLILFKQNKYSFFDYLSK